MTTKRAKELLRTIWGAQGNLTAEQSAEIEAASEANETAIDCCQRIAGDIFNWRKAGTFSEECVQHFASIGR